MIKFPLKKKSHDNIKRQATKNKDQGSHSLHPSSTTPCRVICTEREKLPDSDES